MIGHGLEHAFRWAAGLADHSGCRRGSCEAEVIEGHGPAWGLQGSCQGGVSSVGVAEGATLEEETGPLGSLTGRAWGTVPWPWSCSQDRARPGVEMLDTAGLLGWQAFGPWVRRMLL